MPTLHVFPRTWRNRALLAGGAVIVLLAAAAIILATHWPFTRNKILKSIQESWPGTVQAGGFRSTFFPHPGCVMEDLVLSLASDRAKEPVRVLVKRTEIRAGYSDLLLRPGYMARLAIEGLRIKIPVYESGPDGKSNGTSSQPVTTTFGEIEMGDAALEIKRSEGKPPLVFNIHRLIAQPVRGDAPVSYDATLRNPEPPGEIHVHGRLGPWKSKELKTVPVSGSYTFEQADLGVFSGIAGILSSSGTFEGPLEQIAVQGALQIPAFQVTRAHHDVGLSANFRASVNGMNGNVHLENVEASFLRTTVHGEGTIDSMVGKPGKTASLNLAVPNGRIQDVLDLFVKEKPPPMTGTAEFQARVVIPPGSIPFLKKLEMDGNFSIGNAALANQSRQDEVEVLSQRASGEKDLEEPPRVNGQVEGKFSLRKGNANFSSLSFEIPGASVFMTGRYDLLNERIDLHGDAKTDAKLSAQATGLKAVLLKPLDVLFKKKDAGADVRVEMTGTYDKPHFGVELPVKK